MKLKGKTVLVTGGSRGLGASICRAFAAEGASVAVNYRESKDKAEAVVNEITSSGGRAIAIQADVRDEEAVRRMVKEIEGEWGPVEILVNNALYRYEFDPDHRSPSDTLTWEEMQNQLDGTLKGTFHCVQAVLKKMKEQQFGRIINIGTNLVNHPVVPYHDYTAAKAALMGFTRTLAAELGPFNITVNTVAGGLLDRTRASRKTSDEVFELVRSITPLRRVTRPDDVAGAVLFFASDWARQITGQYLIVDGGLVMN
ncbi:3-oxoacyl-[acyl-carrier protein] reductase [Melghirimyces profundicolus]|uniref:3-oxoacyl-[acyl-carrier protein] reductase n=1 Tax=Melghirimyces profundicolus TaxID=1242148 RepID=A0A2T6C7R8_9BACL|nr:3-oxoacyl-ACP reductase [Melghirimyces profundicolus]PTX64367.1 3-oxoacyl-[acyl-carrier protein] reductase [Melghirimyces profundicolus]